MSRRFLGASVTAALLTLAGLTLATAAAQHPPDLPLNLRPDCRPLVPANFDFTEELIPVPAADPCEHLTASILKVANHVLQAVTGGWIEVDLSEESEPTAPNWPERIREMPQELQEPDEPDGGCLTHEWDGWTGSCRKPSEEPPTATIDLGELGCQIIGFNSDDSTQCPRKLQEARELFRIGERCRSRGDFDMANNCYREVQRLCPGSNVAQLAQARALDRDAEEDGTTEEEEQPSKEDVEEMVRQLNEVAEALAHQLKASKKSGQHDSPCCPFAHMIDPAELIREMDLQKLKDAHSLYLIGERCRRNGDPGLACRFYQEAMEACPASRFAQKARIRFVQIVVRQRLNDAQGVEEQGGPGRRPDVEPVTKPAIGSTPPPTEDQDLAQEVVEESVPMAVEGKVQTPGSIMFRFGVNNEGGLIGSIEITPKNSTWAYYFGKIENGSEELPSPRVELEMIEALDRVLREVVESLPRITITPVETWSIPPTESVDEPEPPAAWIDVREIEKTLKLPFRLQNLRLTEQTQDQGFPEGRDACLDLSDVLRQMVATRPTGVQLKIDAARLGMLLSQGESALRCLDCELISDLEGRSYVVYPATGKR